MLNKTFTPFADISEIEKKLQGVRNAFSKLLTNTTSR